MCVDNASMCLQHYDCGSLADAPGDFPCDDHAGMSHGMELALWNANYVMTALFTLETAIKLIGLGFWEYVRVSCPMALLTMLQTYQAWPFTMKVNHVIT